MNFIIIIPVYSRPFCLKRLIECLVLSAHYKSQDNKCKYHLCFSVDPHSDQNITKEILTIIDKVEWDLGEKKVIEHKEHLGLFKNILFCGGLSKNYDACIVLESDLIVSPFCLDYIYESHKFFNEDSNIAGISLYSYQYSETENGGFPFTPINEGCDNYFMRFPSSWGQIWNYHQWLDFETWLANNYEENFKDQKLPENVCGWSSQSWKKQFCRYLVDSSKYFVYPHVSLSSNTGAIGSHYVKQSNKYKVPLLFGKKQWSFKALNDLNITYNQFFISEITNQKNLKIDDHYRLHQLGDYLLREEGYIFSKFVNIVNHSVLDKSHLLSNTATKTNILNHINNSFYREYKNFRKTLLINTLNNIYFVELLTFTLECLYKKIIEKIYERINKIFRRK